MVLKTLESKYHDSTRSSRSTFEKGCSKQLNRLNEWTTGLLRTEAGRVQNADHSDGLLRHAEKRHFGFYYIVFVGLQCRLRVLK